MPKDPDNSGYLGTHFPFLKDTVAEFVKDECRARQIDLEAVRIEEDPHVTIRYGFNKSVSREDVVDALAGINLNRSSFKGVLLGKVDYFSTEDGDAVYASVAGPELLWKMNERLRRLPGITTFPQYKPHMTLAYVPKGTGKSFVGLPAFEGQTVRMVGFEFNNNGAKEDIELSEVFRRSPDVLQRGYLALLADLS